MPEELSACVAEVDPCDYLSEIDVCGYVACCRLPRIRVTPSELVIHKTSYLTAEDSSKGVTVCRSPSTGSVPDRRCSAIAREC